MIRIAIKEYLERLRAIELVNGTNRDVPSVRKLSQAVNVHYVTLNKMVNNHGKSIRIELLSDIIEHLRSIGFETDISDILKYEAKQA